MGWETLRKILLGPTPQEQQAAAEAERQRRRRLAAEDREDQVAEARADEEIARLDASRSAHQAERARHGVERQLWDRLHQAPPQEQAHIAGLAADTAAELKRRERGEPRPAPFPGLSPKKLALKAALKLAELPLGRRLPLLSQLAAEMMEVDADLGMAMLEEIPGALALLGHGPEFLSLPAPEPPAAALPPPEPKPAVTEVLLTLAPSPAARAPDALPSYQMDPWQAGQEPGHAVIGTYAGTGEPAVLPLGAFAHHAAVFGATGAGKTRLITLLVAEHLRQGASALVTDAKAQTLRELASFANMPPPKVAALLFDEPCLPGWNPFLEGRGFAETAELVTGIFYDLYKDSWGVRLNRLFKSALLVLAAHRLSLFEVPKFLTSRLVRERLVQPLEGHPFSEDDLAAWVQARQFLETEFGAWKSDKQAESLSPVTNKLSDFLGQRLFVQSLCALQNTVSLSELWEGQMLWLSHLDFDQRPEAARILGGFLARLLFAETHRRRAGERPVVFVADEVDQTEAAMGAGLRETLSRKRSAGIRMVVGAQHFSQLSRELKASVRANCGVLVFFKLGPDDAKEAAAFLAKVDPYGDTDRWEQTLLGLPRGRCAVWVRGSAPRLVEVARIHLKESPVRSSRTAPESLSEVMAERTARIAELGRKPPLAPPPLTPPADRPSRPGTAPPSPTPPPAVPPIRWNDDDTLA